MGEKTIGDKIRLLRKERGLTQTELAARAKIHHQTVSDLERGVIPDPGVSVVQRVAAALGVPPVAFLDEPVSQEVSDSIESFLAGPLAEQLALSEAERAWLRSGVPASMWVAAPPTHAGLLLLVHFYRDRRR